MNELPTVAPSTVNPLEPATPSDLQRDMSQVASGMAIAISGKFVGRGLLAISQIILARTLGPALFGLFALGWTVLQLVGALAPMGLSKGVVRFGATLWPDDLPGFKSIVNQSVGIGSVSSLFAGLAVFLAAPTLETVFNQPGLAMVLRLIAVAIPFLGVMTILVATTQISRQMKYGVYAEELARPLSNLALIAVSLVLSLGLFGATAATTISFMVGFVLAAYYVIKLYPGLRQVDAERHVQSMSLLRFSIPTMMADVLIMMVVWINPLLIGYFLPSDQVGIYQALSQIPIVFSIILRAVNSIFAPFIASLYHQGQLDRLQSLFKVTTKWTISLSLPLYIVICFTSQQLAHFVFGPAYASESAVLLLLATAQMINVATGSVGFMLIMTGHQRDWFVMSTVGFAVSLLMNVWLLQLIGIMGTALASLVVISFLNVGGLIRIYQLIGIQPYDKRTFKALAAGGIMVVVELAMQLALPEQTWFLLILTSIIAVAVYLLALWRLGLDDEDRDLLNTLTSQMKGAVPSWKSRV